MVRIANRLVVFVVVAAAVVSLFALYLGQTELSYLSPEVTQIQLCITALFVTQSFREMTKRFIISRSIG